MKITSFDSSSNKINRDITQYNLFNLFQKNIANNQDIVLYPYLVPREYEMRLDRISNWIYGTVDYIEELMTLNDIISPYSVKEGQLLFYCDSSDFSRLYTADGMFNDQESIRATLLNSSQPNRNKTNAGIDQNLPPNIMPSNLQQIVVNNDNKIEILNKFK